MDWLGYPAVESYRGLDLSQLPLNYAYVRANTTIDNVAVYGVSDDCFHCPYKLEKFLRAGEEASWQVDTSVQRSWRILRNSFVNEISPKTKGGLLCEMRPTFYEFGVYSLDVGKCEVKPELSPIDSYFPLLLSTLVLLGCFILYKVINYVIKRRKGIVELRQEKGPQTNFDNFDEENYPALYIFRGILLAAIIFLTTGGGGYPMFQNTWGGLSLAECLFFAYAWSVGVNIPNVIDEAFTRQTKCIMIRNIFLRAFFLIALGTVIDSTVEYNRHSIYADKYHSLGAIWCPLQRLGIAYFIVASAYTLTVQRYQMKSKTTICMAVANLVSLLWCWIISAFLLAIIIILISTLVSFNCLAAVTMENHRDVDDILSDDSENCNNGFTEYVNKLFVADSEKVVDVNGFVGFSRGILGVMSTIMYTMIGLKAGIIYVSYKTHSVTLKLWGLWATVLGVAAIVFAGVSYPLDFNLWPIASILFLTTISLYVFMVTYAVVEVCSKNSPALCTFGVTSLPVLCGHLLFSNSIPFRWDMHFNTHLLYLLQNYWIVSLWFVISWLLKKKSIRFEI